MESSLASRISGLFTSRPPPLQLDIRPDHGDIVFEGRPNPRNAPQYITGTVQVKSLESFDIRQIRVALQSKRRINHSLISQKLSPIPNIEPFKRKVSEVIDTRAIVNPDGSVLRRIEPGVHYWPFSLKVPGDCTESIEGLESSGLYLIYEVVAVIQRAYLQRDIMQTKKVKVLRTILQCDEERLLSRQHSINDPQSIEKLWTAKMKYMITLPSRTMIYGDFVTAAFEFQLIDDKIEIGTVHFCVEEKISVQNPDKFLQKATWQDKLCEQRREPPEGSRFECPVTLLENVRFQLSFRLPRCLSELRQSVLDYQWIEIKHKIFFHILFINGDGCRSAIRVQFPIMLLMSRSLLPAGDYGIVTNTLGEPTAQCGSTMESMIARPPMYHFHMQDRTEDPPSEIHRSALDSANGDAGGDQSGNVASTLPATSTSSTAPQIANGSNATGATTNGAKTNGATANGANSNGANTNGLEDPSEQRPQAEHVDFNIELLNRVSSNNAAPQDETPSASTAGPPAHDRIPRSSSANDRPTPMPPGTQENVSPRSRNNKFSSL